MNGLVRVLVVAGTASLAISSFALASTDPEVEALKKQVERLQLRVNTLDAQVKELLARADVSPPSSAALSAPVAATSPAYEAEAQAIINDVIRLTDQGQADAARAKLDELRARYGASKVAGQGTYFSNEIAVIGKSAPGDWGLNNWFQGRNEIDLSGQPTTLVVFFEEWCPHCRDEMPKLQQLYAAHRSQGLQVLGITTVTQTSTDEKVRAYLGETRIQFPVGKESGSASTYFNVKGIPAAAIVKGGKVVWRGHPIRLTDEVVSRWLGAH